MRSKRSTGNRNAFLHRAQKKCAWARKKASFVKEGKSTGMEIAQHLKMKPVVPRFPFFPRVSHFVQWFSALFLFQYTPACNSGVSRGGQVGEIKLTSPLGQVLEAGCVMVKKKSSSPILRGSRGVCDLLPTKSMT